MEPLINNCILFLFWILTPTMDASNSVKQADRFGQDYETYFDPDVYMRQYWVFPESLEETDILYNIYNTGDIKGKRLLNIDTGPNICPIIPAAKFFDAITLTGFAACNINVLRKWINREPDVHKLEPFFRYQAKRDGNEEDWARLEEEMRNKVKSILPCDVHQSDPLYPNTYDQFDAVSSSLTLESACADAEQYSRAMHNVTSLLKPGGHLVLNGKLNETYYMCGEERFSVLSVNKEMVIAAMTEAGLDNIVWYEVDRKNKHTFADHTGTFAAVAIKN